MELAEVKAAVPEMECLVFHEERPSASGTLRRCEIYWKKPDRIRRGFPSALRGIRAAAVMPSRRMEMPTRSIDSFQDAQATVPSL